MHKNFLKTQEKAMLNIGWKLPVDRCVSTSVKKKKLKTTDLDGIVLSEIRQIEKIKLFIFFVTHRENNI